MSPDRYANAVSDAQRRDEDIENAIKPSFDLQSGHGALTILHQQNRQSPHFESVGNSYGRPPRFAEEGRAGTSVKQEQDMEFFDESEKTHQKLENDRTEFLAELDGIKEARKQRLQAYKIKNDQARQTASEPHTNQRGAEVSQTPLFLTQLPPKTETTTVLPAVPSRPTIEDRIKEIECERTTLLSWADDPHGDTYVFIDPPAQQPEQSYNMYNDYVSRYQRPLVIRSATLFDLNSQFFDRLLNPTAQYRTVRRRGLVGRLPDHIEYVIDLTPPSEGEDAAWLMTELCCVEGVRNWHQAWARWDISKTLVGGQDEFLKQAEDEEAQDLPQPELSPIRHRNSIERVLNAIRNTDPRLDSAVKVYTTFVVARFFDIVHSPLTDYIVRWLRAPPNSLFIEALPEIALKIGDGFQCYDLIRDSFAILVGEEALASLVGKSNPTHTVNGRKRNDVPESYQTRIEYASKSFVDRTTQIFAALVEPNMRWMETLQQFQVLSDNENESVVLLVQETKAAFKAFVRGAIYSVLWSDFDNTPAIELGWGSGDSLYPRTSQTAFWNSLDVTGRIMTRTFWSALEEFCKCGLAGPINLTSWTQPDVSLGWTARLSYEKKQVMCFEYGISEIRHGYLKNLTRRCCNGQPGKSTGLLKPLPIQPFRTSPTYDQEESGPDSPWNDFSSCPVGPQETNVNRTGNPDGILNLSHYGPVVDLEQFCREVEYHILRVCSAMLGSPDGSNREDTMKQVMTPTLVCLDEAEWKYLPLYAGGLDDGSGGVFNDDVPMAETGFSTAGPGVHTGTGSSTASSDFEYVGDRDLESTHHTSTMTNDSFSDQLDHRKVYAGGDDEDSLWKHIRNNKALDGSTTMSHVDTATMAAPSTVDDTEYEHGFVLPLRSKDPEATTDSTAAKVSLTKPEESEGNIKEASSEQEDYSDIFMCSDDDGDMDSDDDDTATERGEDDNPVATADKSEIVDSDDEDMVLV
ncbi:MAG: hypothetical protein Q9223_003758 [Gallowayella weberi]